ncbi:hypothetical protein EJ06DRAFT_581841 [Trichodelitschia bisporula]|uniref:Zn(2)-C6 fungal-type domain-containing protein n=1 Tax=Trichodelitschia bisporula TaxID=703511 RepID=A0A6G1HXW9_9PEZI|nr:hypothetical protein EJ06DRAFT_581841 [Trichodelitschia bisporula]
MSQQAASPGASKRSDPLPGNTPLSGNAASASSNSEDTHGRRERAAIAAQACETCRTRKSKCDEKRPKCGLCRRLNVACTYREPQPTKKDKSIQHIMDQLSRMENKLNVIGMVINPASGLFEPRPDIPSGGFPSPPSIGPGSSATVDGRASSQLDVAPDKYQPDQSSHPRLPPDVPTSYQHLTAPHKVLLWPAVLECFQRYGFDPANELKLLKSEGTHWFINLELRKDAWSLPCSVAPLTTLVPSEGIGDDDEPRVSFEGLSPQLMGDYTENYFSSFNILYPLLDRHSFEEGALRTVAETGFAYGDTASVLALLVFALGQMAYAGIYEEPVEIYHHGLSPSGFRGGSRKRPPGLELFNEARKRLGLICTQTSLENVQIFVLFAVYFEACSRHIDFWRSSVSAAMTLQVLISCDDIDWDSSYGQQIIKAYWTCNLMESWYHMDLDLPRTGISDLESQVPLPGNSAPFDQREEGLHMQFMAMITLRRLITRIHVMIFATASSHVEISPAPDPPLALVSELLTQLEQWRHLLPPLLQWTDEEPHAYPEINNKQTTEPLFSFEVRQLESPSDPRTLYALLLSQLRSRFYYAKYLAARPFVYKVLHFPSLVTTTDREYALCCLRAALLWPVAMEPCRSQKRLVPYLFAWTQNFLGVLILLRLATENEILRDLLGPDGGFLMKNTEKTVVALIEWLRDVKAVDGTAEFGWAAVSRLWGVTDDGP